MKTTIILVAAIALSGSPASKVDRIFEVVDASALKKTSTAVIQRQLAEMAPSAGEDYRVSYAYAVALIRANRFPDALQVVAALVTLKPDFWPAHRARVWLLLTMRKGSEALAALEALATLLPIQAAPGDEELSHLEIAQFLGTAVGYLEGPGQAFVKAPALTKFKTSILARLSGRRREVFKEQAKAVSDELAKFERGEAERQTRVQSKKQKVLQVVDEKREDLLKAQAETESQSQQTAQQLRAQWEKLTSELATTIKAYDDLRLQSIPAQDQLIRTQSQLYALENPVKDNQGRTPAAARDLYNRRAPGLQQTITALTGQLAQAAASMDRLMSRGAVIESQLSQLQVAGRQVGEAFDLKEQQFSKQGKSIAAQKKRAADSLIKKTGTLNDRLRAFRMYDDFPYDTEKQRILKMLGATN